METLELLHTQLAKLADKVEQLTNHVGNIQSTCALRHNVDLYNEIQRVGWCTQQLEKRLQKQQELNKQSKDIHQELDDNIDEINTVIDSIKLRIKHLQDQINSLQNIKSKKEQTNLTIKTQIIITVVGAILLSLLTSLGSCVYTNLIEPITNNKNKYIQQRDIRPSFNDEHQTNNSKKKNK